MIQEDIYSILTDNTIVTDICSTRIYPIELPRGSAVPAIVYNITITPVRSLDGESGLDNGIVEVTCWAKTYKTAHLLAAAVRLAFVESGIGTVADNLDDMRDPETHNYGVVVRMNAWSEANTNRGDNMAQIVFTGDGTTTEFTLPQFRSGSLLVFFNGVLAQKGTPTDGLGAYYEKPTLDGFIFRIAPKGGEYADEILAFYAKASV